MGFGIICFCCSVTCVKKSIQKYMDIVGMSMDY